MGKQHAISVEQLEEIVMARGAITNKKIDKRLHAVELRGRGLKNPEIAAKLDTSADVISIWVSRYVKDGITALVGWNYGGNRRNLSLDEEAAFLAKYKEQAETGQIVDVGEIKAAYEALVGHSIGGSQIYYVLQRHGWRKVMPRSKHPNKASDEAIDASKKLTASTKK
jgi:transposase